MLDFLRHDPDETMATFGEANLVRTQQGKLEVRGGTVQDQAAAWDWAEQFLRPPHQSRCSTCW